MIAEARRSAPHVARNRGPILDALRQLLAKTGLVLEIASGTGEHAVFLARQLPALDWQPSDPDPVMRASIAAWAADARLSNLRPPLDLDATRPDWPIAAADAILCCNMIHIAPWAAAVGLIAEAARILPMGGPLILYGPFARGGRHTAPSNELFDAWLKARNAEWGVRDLDTVAETAAGHGLVLAEIADMPANNMVVAFRRQSAG